MTPSQETHARSIAKHMIEYAGPFVTRMRQFADAEPGDLSFWPTERFEDEIIQQVEHVKKELDQVIRDMMPVDKYA